MKYYNLILEDGFYKKVKACAIMNDQTIQAFIKEALEDKLGVEENAESEKE